MKYKFFWYIFLIWLEQFPRAHLHSLKVMKNLFITKLIFVIATLLPITHSKMTHQLIFPSSANFPHAKLHGTIDRVLEDFTLCHWSKINAPISWGSIFSYNTKDLDNVLMSWMGYKGNYQFNQNNGLVIAFESGQNSTNWVHSCVTSSTLRGEWVFFINGIVANATVLDNPRTPISPNGIVVLGQDHTTKLGEFHAGHRFKGFIADVFLWDRVLTPKEISEVYACKYAEEANVINWNLDAWELVDGTRVSPVNLPCGVIKF